MLGNMAKTTKKQLVIAAFRIKERNAPKFLCPVCNYRGPFRTEKADTGNRRFGRCPNCHALERHRMQYAVLTGLFDKGVISQGRMLHFAPEVFFRGFFAPRFERYETADIVPEGVDHAVDIRKLPFEDGSFDFVFASHVLEHIDDDQAALREIRRVLTPSGIAILPVPIVAPKTIEYPEPNPHETMHVRAPGLDYFDRYKQHFEHIEIYHSDDMPAEFQCYAYDDRTKYPTPTSPLMPPMPGARHPDFVPVCFAAKPAHKTLLSRPP